MTTSIIATSLFFPIQGRASEQPSPNVAMAEAILHGKRKFVKESLLNDNFSTNPHALVNGLGNDNSMMANVLSQYQNKNDENYSAAYKTAVDIMEKVYNGSDYTQSVTDYVTEFAASLLEFFNLDASGVMSDLTKSIGEIRYESILKDSLDADYTTSSGIKLSSKESELINLRRLEKGAKNLSSFTSLFKSLADNDSGSANGADMLDYYNNFLLPYGDKVNTVLSSFSSEQGSWDKESLEAMNNFITAIAMVQQGDRFVTSSDAVGQKIVTYCPTYFLDESTLDLIGFANNGMKNASTAISSYMFIRSIQEQKDSIAGPLQRIAENTSDSSMKNVYNTFANEISSSADSQTVKYETVIRYINQSGTVSNFISGKISDGVKNAANVANLGTEYTALSSVFSKASNVVGISGWCADKLIGFESTCKKTYELKYLDKMIKQAVKTCNNDISTYESNKTDSNATKVLDDLQFIQKLRLRGETISYSMMHNQFDSPLVKLLATGTLNKDEMADSYLDKIYQYHIDALVGASVMPLSTDGFTVNDGETLTLLYDARYGGVYGLYTKSDKSIYSIAESQYRFANGINVSSGGKLVTATSDFYIPYIKNNGGTVLIGNNVQNLSELSQSSGTATFGNGSFSVYDMQIDGGTVNSGGTASLVCDNVNISNKPTITNVAFTTNTSNISGELQLNGNKFIVNSQATISGTIDGGDVWINGNLKSNSSNVSNLNISGNNNQNIEGNLNVENLNYSSNGTVNQQGTIYVSGNVQNTSTNIINSENTIIKSTGDIAGNYYNSGITLDGTTLSSGKTIKGNVFTKNTVNLGDITVLSSISQESGTLNLNGDVTVKSDAHFNGTVTQGNNDFYSYGDIDGKDITLGNLTMCGKLPQKIESSLQVNDFCNKNKQLTVNATVVVKGAATSENAPINGKNIKLTDTASFGDTYYKGDITVDGLSGSLPQNLYGKLYLTNDITHSGKSNIESLEHTGGTLTLAENADLTVKGIFNNSSSAQIQGDGIINVDSDLYNSGTMDVGTVNLNGDLSNSGTFNAKNLNITSKIPITVSGDEISVTNLDIIGKKQVTVSSVIKVSGKYKGNSKVVNPKNIVVLQLDSNNDISYDDLLNINGDLNIDGYTLIAKKGLTVTNGNIILSNGGKLIVEGNTNISGSSSNKINIDDTSSMKLNKLTFVKGIGNIEVDGDLHFMGDTSLTSTNISGNGTVTINADLYGSSLTINKPQNFNITGKTPQIIECGGANFDNLNIFNPCVSGVTFSDTVYCYGTLTTNDTKIKGTITTK